MLKQIVGIRDRNKTLPQSLAESLVKDCTSMSIVTTVENSIAHYRHDKPLTAKEFMDIQSSDDFKDRDFGFVFTKGGVLTPESLQPFIGVKNHSGEAVCAVLLGGTTMVPMPPNSSHAQSYHTFQKIQVKLDRLYNSVSNAEKFKDLIRGGEFMEDMDMLLGTEGVMSILMFDGEFIPHGHSSKGGDYSWGRINDSLGYKEKAEKPAEPEKKPGLLSKIGSVIAPKATEEPKKESDPPKVDEATPVATPSPETPVTVPAGMVVFEQYRPRANIKKQKDLHRLLNDKLGCVPMNAMETYENGGTFPVPKTAIKFGRTDQYELFRIAANRSSTNYVPLEVLTQVPPTPPKEEPAPKVDAPDVSHVVSAAGKKHFSEVFGKRGTIMNAFAESREEILNPKVLSKRDNQASSTFAQQSGYKDGVYNTLGWSEEDIKAFLKGEDPTLVFLWARDMTLEVIKLAAAAKEKGGETTVTAPKKPGLLSGLKVA